MFNSCKFNNVKFNSVCVYEPITPDIIEHGLRVRRHKRIKSKTQRFSVKGTKLLFYTQFLNMLGLVLFENLLDVSVRGTLLQKLELNFGLQASVLLPFIETKDIIGLVQYLVIEQIDLKGLKLFLETQAQEMTGSKLSYTTKEQLFKGLVKYFYKQDNIIKGRKEINNILEALDLFEEEE